MGIPAPRCSFCDRHARQVRRLIHAPRGLHICDICVRSCLELLAEQAEMERMMFPRARPVRRPRWWASGHRWRAVQVTGL